MLKLTRWTTSHRRLVVLAWIVLAAGVLGASQTVGQRNANNFSLPNTDSQRAVDLLQSRFPAQAGDADQIVFRARTGMLTDAPTRAVVTPLLLRIARLPHVAGVVSPYDTGAGAISKSGKIGFATVEFDQRASQIPKAAIDRMITTATSARSSALQIELGDDVLVELVDQVVLVRVATVDSAHADAGSLGDLVERHAEPALGEGRARSQEDLLPVAFRVAAERPRSSGSR
jgi:RND superfamily putative drug exporter